jgi:hypothetical protein
MNANSRKSDEAKVELILLLRDESSSAFMRLENFRQAEASNTKDHQLAASLSFSYTAKVVTILFMEWK